VDLLLRGLDAAVRVQLQEVLVRIHIFALLKPRINFMNQKGPYVIYALFTRS
jgi:hypothetical protein